MNKIKARPGISITLEYCDIIGFFKNAFIHCRSLDKGNVNMITELNHITIKMSNE